MFLLSGQSLTGGSRAKATLADGKLQLFRFRCDVGSRCSSSSRLNMTVLGHDNGGLVCRRIESRRLLYICSCGKSGSRVRNADLYGLEFRLLEKPTFPADKEGGLVRWTKAGCWISAVRIKYGTCNLLG